MKLELTPKELLNLILSKPPIGDEHSKITIASAGSKKLTSQDLEAQIVMVFEKEELVQLGSYVTLLVNALALSDPNSNPYILDTQIAASKLISLLKDIRLLP